MHSILRVRGILDFGKAVRRIASKQCFYVRQAAEPVPCGLSMN
jgi:hypothetical protein